MSHFLKENSLPANQCSKLAKVNRENSRLSIKCAEAKTYAEAKMSAEAKTFNLLYRMPALAKLKLLYVVSNTVPSFKMIE